jgi:hypothetical protein
MKWARLGATGGVALSHGEDAASTQSSAFTPSSLVHSPVSRLPQHQFRDLQGVKGSSFQELITAGPEG